jgi:hypothetical protein
MSRANELAQRRLALIERGAEQRLAIVSTAATLRERARALRSILNTVGVLAGVGRTLWRYWAEHRAAQGDAPAAATGAPATAAPPPATAAPDRPAG